MIKLGLINIRSPSTKALFVNYMITDHNLDVLCLTETWLKPDDYITLNDYNLFGVMVLHITLPRETSVNAKFPVTFILATVYRPPRHHTEFIKEFADFVSELVQAADKVLIVCHFNIHVDNEKDALE